MTTYSTVRTATFRNADVQAVLAAAAVTGEVELAKDDGAYLLAGTHPDVTVVYAQGMASPRDHESGTIDAAGFDTGWLAQRRHIENTFSGDDYSILVDVERLREACADGRDVAFDIELEVTTWAPGDTPPGLGEGVNHIVHIETVRDPRPADRKAP